MLRTTAGGPALRACLVWAVLAGQREAAGAAADAFAAVEAGDRAWDLGDRRGARQSWRAATGGPPAAAAMAEARLLRVSGNLGLARHGPRADRALALCPAEDPWCDLAEADLLLILADLGLPSDRERAVLLARRAEAALPGPAAARRAWAGDLDAARLTSLPDRGPLGDDLVADGAVTQGPGTWLVGIGAAGAPGAGVALGGRFSTPDLAMQGWSLDAGLSASSRGSLAGALRFETPGTQGFRLRAGGGRLDLARYDDAGATVGAWRYDTATVTAEALWRVGRWTAGAGPRVAWDQEGAATWWGPGAQASAAWTRQRRAHPWGWPSGPAGGGAVHSTFGPALGLGLADHDHAASEAWLEWATVQGQVWGGLRADMAATWGDEAPPWRAPSAGGGRWLRGSPTGRHRDARGGAAQVELRRPLVGPLAVAGFAEAAWLDGPHGDVGAGLRLVLPPRPRNTARVDFAVGDDGWAITAGIGESF